jgi:ribonucleoside-diphosphate reductase alpha chain
MEYPVLHPKFIEWFFSKSVDEILTFEQTKSLLENYTKDEIQKLFEESPWFKSEADDINWLKRVEIQSIIQKYTSHSISSTINLPNNASKEDVAEIYIKAWESGLKGVTVYRDGCRTGVLVKDNNAKDSKKFVQIDAPKRPKELKCDIYTVMIKGEYWNIIVGLLEDQPYEVFAVTKFTNDKSGFLFKVKKGEYNLLNDKKELIYANITSINSFEEENITRLISMSLRHGANVSFICEQLTKTVGEIHSFSKGISRTLKHYIKDGTKSTLTCENCGEAAIIFVEGCQSCTNCGNSKCG